MPDRLLLCYRPLCSKKLRHVCSLRFPVSCQSRLQDWVEWAMPLLQGGVGDIPGTLKPIYQRSHDVAFIRCEQCRCEMHIVLLLRFDALWCLSQHQHTTDKQPKLSGRATAGAKPQRCSS